MAIIPPLIIITESDEWWPMVCHNFVADLCFGLSTRCGNTNSKVSKVKSCLLLLGKKCDVFNKLLLRS